ncbi:DUF4382 domain-containing protein [Fodinibius salsisoli]|uniref:DUF4382 domain-containing protein n=1 Tax=Fodinibius salsisoli TaxID=2820877 RepID=A0ABT3PJH6_9BACT|nr:DUF4382 domain-containing protein [Fodinibius salsisoli]MCW9705339.1 DUF4382 domain-containing protein [Fodinibius salsisoli]
MNKSKITIISQRFFQSLFVLGLISFLAISCDDINMDGPQNPKGHLNVYLTDAPGDYEEVNVDVQGLRIHYTPFDSDTVEADEKDGKWIDLPVDPKVINLLDLTNGVEELLSSADLDPGHYKELRLILGKDNTVVIDGNTHTLKVPSGQQSGYKIKFKTDLESGEELDLIVDFDAARSVHKAGRSGKYILKPVLKAFVEDGEESDVGSVAGTVLPADSESYVFAIMDGDTVTSTQVDTLGSFLLRGLEEGLYDLSVQPGSDEYLEGEVNGVLVEDDTETNVGEIMLGENN